MCFSASASFTASAGLLIIGAVAFKQAKTIPQHVLAGIPLVFAFQQFGEGLLWISLMNAGWSGWQSFSMYFFLVIAQVLWPSYVPFSMLLFERNPLRKRILQLLLGVGALTSIYFIICLAVYPAAPVMNDHHISYQLEFPMTGKWYGGIPYLLAAACSPFVSSIKPLRWFGAVLVFSYLIAYILYGDELISVWCYFAAVLSILIIYLVRKISFQIPAYKA